MDSSRLQKYHNNFFWRYLIGIIVSFVMLIALRGLQRTYFPYVWTDKQKEIQQTFYGQIWILKICMNSYASKLGYLQSRF